jgi:hypothetical protein
MVTNVFCEPEFMVLMTITMYHGNVYIVAQQEAMSPAYVETIPTLNLKWI